MIGQIYHAAIYQPLLNLLVILYKFIPDIGVVIILVTLLIRLLLAPSFQKSLKSQKQMNEMQPKLNAVREKYKNNQEEQAKAMMALYKEHKVNPFSSCLPLIIQLPILIALYQVFRNALNGKSIEGLYSFVHFSGSINPFFLKVIDLSKIAWGEHIYIPGIILVILAGVTQFWQSKMMVPQSQSTDSTAKIMAFQTTYLLPLVSVFITARFPAGLALYWVVTTVFSIAQQYYIMREPSPKN